MGPFLKVHRQNNHFKDRGIKINICKYNDHGKLKSNV